MCLFITSFILDFKFVILDLRHGSAGNIRSAGRFLKNFAANFVEKDSRRRTQDPNFSTLELSNFRTSLKLPTATANCLLSHGLIVAGEIA
jgi:hypothetical protein